jgi:hypothetical protein
MYSHFQAAVEALRSRYCVLATAPLLASVMVALAHPPLGVAHKRVYTSGPVKPLKRAAGVSVELLWR